MYLDFCVGSSKDNTDDIIPCIPVAQNTSGVVEIKNGFLYIDDYNNLTAYNLLTLKALSDGVYNASLDNSSTGSNAFHMEIGRTLFLYMRLCNKANLCATKLVNTVVITNTDTTMESSVDGMSFTLGVQPAATRRKRTDDSGLIALISTPNGLYYYTIKYV